MHPSAGSPVVTSSYPQPESQPGHPPHSRPLSHVQVRAFTPRSRHTRWQGHRVFLSLPLESPPPSDLDVYVGGPGDALGCLVPTSTPQGSS